MLSSLLDRKPSPTNQIDRIWTIGSALIVLSTIFIFSTRTVADPDLWGHVRFGLDMLEAKEIVQVDVYSYLTEGQRWINHEWLAEVIFALAWIAGESIGLQLLNLGVCSLTFLLAFTFLYRKGIEPLRITILFIPAVILLSPSIFAIRPQIFTYFLFVITMIIISLAEQRKYYLLWFTPLIMLAWVNLHGGFLAGLAILFLWGFLHLIYDKHSWKQVLPPLLVSIVVAFINPYGIDLLTFLIRTATVSRPEITDWQPLSLTSFLGAFYLITLIVVVLGLVYSRLSRSLVMIILFSILMLLPMIAIRHLQLTSVAMFLLTAEHIWDSWDRARSTVDRKQPKSLWVATLPLITSIAIIVLLTPNSQDIIITVAKDRYPIDNISLLKQIDAEGNMAVNFDWGEYTIWHLGPRVKVSMDGRRETVYSEEIYEKYKYFHLGVEDWDALLNDYTTDIVLVDTSSSTYNLLDLSPDWLVVHEDMVSTLFVPTDSPLIIPLQHAVTDLVPSAQTTNFP